MKNEFAEKLRDLREQSGMTLNELAKKANISAVHLSSLERGEHKPNSTTVYRIAKAFDYDYNELYELFQLLNHEAHYKQNNNHNQFLVCSLLQNYISSFLKEHSLIYKM